MPASSIRVDFYLLKENNAEAPWLVACRLLEKAYQRRHRIFVLCNSKENAEYLDELLWTYKNDSFIPHNLQGEGPEPAPPVQIGYDITPSGFNDILLNMASSIPPFFLQFRRIMQIVGADEPAKNLAREHYREYRANHCQLHTHHL